MDKNEIESVDKIKTRVVGIDIRVDRTTYAVVDIRGEIVAQDYFLTTDYTDLNEYISALCEKVVALVEENGGYETIRSVGVSAPSSSSVTGCIENAANLPWKGVIPLSALLRDRLGLAVAVANDAHITALSEKSYGSAHGMKDFVVVSISHGGLGRTWDIMALLVSWGILVLKWTDVSVVVETRGVWRLTAERRDWSRRLKN